MDFSNLGDIVNLEPWWRFAVALLIGSLIGLEREFVQQKVAEDPDFAGLRTFALIALFGAVSAYLVKDFGIVPAAVALGGFMVLVIASHVAAVFRENEEGATTEVAAFITYLLGWLVIVRQVPVAIALGVVVAGILALKPNVQRIVEKMSATDLHTILLFGILAAVILPLLPNKDYGPYGVINPFKIWLLVVFISGISFAGYVLMKTIGAEKGVPISGALGGLVSSTATTVGFSGRSKESPQLSDVFAQGILLASSIMFPRILLEVLAVNRALLPYVVLPIGAMFVTGLLMAYFLWRRVRENKDEVETKAVEVSNPLKLTTALTFAVVFTVVAIIVEVMKDLFGSVGVYITSLITGLTDVDAITLSLAQHATGDLDPNVAATGIVIAAITNTAVKAGIAYSVGSPELRGIILRTFAVIITVGLVTGVVTLIM